jgi:hypothetical protein
MGVSAFSSGFDIHNVAYLRAFDASGADFCGKWQKSGRMAGMRLSSV